MGGWHIKERIKKEWQRIETDEKKSKGRKEKEIWEKANERKHKDKKEEEGVVYNKIKDRMVRRENKRNMEEIVEEKENGFTVGEEKTPNK